MSMDTENRCHYCSKTPGAHSFYCFQSSREGNLLYKTVIAEAKLFDKPTTIIHHINSDIQLQPGKRWEWMIDFKGASLKHYMAFNTVRIISKWINHEKQDKCKELRKIYLMNGKKSLLNPMVWLAKLFLPSHIKIVYF